jgi:hypothetical protein
MRTNPYDDCGATSLRLHHHASHTVPLERPPSDFHRAIKAFIHSFIHPFFHYDDSVRPDQREA